MKGLGTSSSRRSELFAHLKAHRLQPAELRSGVTEGLLARLPPPPSDWPFYEIADAGRRSVPGLRLRRGRSATISFVFTGAIKQESSAPKSAQFTLGKWRPDGTGLSLVKAREAAAALKAQLRAGADPRPNSAPAPEQSEAEKPVTLNMAYELYKAARTGRKKKPLAATTQVEYKRIIEVALAKFADCPLDELRDDPRPLIKYFNATSERTPAEANTQMRVLRAVWNRAHKVMPSKVQAPPAIWDMNEVEPRNAGYITREVPALWKAINALPDPASRKGAFILLFLGLREGALLAMEWSHINEEQKTLVVRSKGKTLQLALSDVALSVLKARTVENDAAPGNPFVFPSLRGPRGAQPGASLDDTWRHRDKLHFSAIPPASAYVAQKGEAASTHPHVFRHTYRTLATSAGASEIAIRLLMGHSLQGDVSFDYLTADLDWLKRAQDMISAYILKSAGKPKTFRFDRDAFQTEASVR